MRLIFILFICSLLTFFIFNSNEKVCDGKVYENLSSIEKTNCCVVHINGKYSLRDCISLRID